MGPEEDRDGPDDDTRTSAQLAADRAVIALAPFHFDPRCYADCDGDIRKANEYAERAHVEEFLKDEWLLEQGDRAKELLRSPAARAIIDALSFELLARRTVRSPTPTASARSSRPRWRTCRTRSIPNSYPIPSSSRRPTNNPNQRPTPSALAVAVPFHRIWGKPE